MQTETKPSDGAMRAANKILDLCEGRPLPSSDAIRDIIDRETAAPDLLAAVEGAIERVEIANAEGDPILSAWLDAARAAIARAKGGD